MTPLLPSLLHSLFTFFWYLYNIFEGAGREGSAAQ